MHLTIVKLKKLKFYRIESGAKGKAEAGLLPSVSYHEITFD